jgi:hypothetical protein
MKSRSLKLGDVGLVDTVALKLLDLVVRCWCLLLDMHILFLAILLFHCFKSASYYYDDDGTTNAANDDDAAADADADDDDTNAADPCLYSPILLLLQLLLLLLLLLLLIYISSRSTGQLVNWSFEFSVLLTSTSKTKSDHV